MRTTAVFGFLLGVTFLMSAVLASAKSDQPTLPSIIEVAGSAQFAAATPIATAIGSTEQTANLSQGSVNLLPSFMLELIQPKGSDGYDHDGNHDGDHDHDRDHDRDKDRDHDKAPIPNPEPVTALLFGAAMLIGGGILRRRRTAQH